MKSQVLRLTSVVVLFSLSSSAWALKERQFLDCYSESIKKLEYSMQPHEGESSVAEDTLAKFGILKVLASVKRGLEADQVAALRKALQESQSCEEFSAKALEGMNLSDPPPVSVTGHCKEGDMPFRDMLLTLDVNTYTLLAKPSAELRRLQSGVVKKSGLEIQCGPHDRRYAQLVIKSLKAGISYAKEVYNLL